MIYNRKWSVYVHLSQSHSIIKSLFRGRSAFYIYILRKKLDKQVSGKATNCIPLAIFYWESEGKNVSRYSLTLKASTTQNWKNPTSIQTQQEAKLHCYFIRSEVPTAMPIKIIVLWDVTAWCPVDICRRFREACCFHIQGRRSWRHNVYPKICWISTRLYCATLLKAAIFLYYWILNNIQTDVNKSNSNC
jgi:hypothetical protein